MTLKSYLAEKGQSQEDFDGLGVAEKEAIFDAITKNNAEFVEGLEKDSNEQKEALKKIEKAQKEQKEMLLNYIDKALNANNANEVEVKETLKDVISKNIEDLKEISKGGSEEIVVKADVSTASIAGNTGAYELSGLGQLNVRTMTMYDMFPKITVSGSNVNKSIRYYDWDEASIVRAADYVEECAQFPESTAAWVQRTCEILKIGDTIPVCEEFFEDESMFAAELEFFLRTNVALKVDNELLNGDGTATQLKGLISSSTTYVPAAAGIADASIYDLIAVLVKQIAAIGGNKYAPNFVLMNNADICKMKLKKDSNNNYIMPPFVTDGGQRVDGLRVVENNAVPANQLVVGDSKFGKIYEAAGVSLSKGWIANQFIEDQMTMKVRQRLALVIREADKAGFQHVTNIDAALVTLAS